MVTKSFNIMLCIINSLFSLFISMTKIKYKNAIKKVFINMLKDLDLTVQTLVMKLNYIHTFISLYTRIYIF